jgi:hypothetical protein
VFRKKRRGKPRQTQSNLTPMITSQINPENQMSKPAMDAATRISDALWSSRLGQWSFPRLAGPGKRPFDQHIDQSRSIATKTFADRRGKLVWLPDRLSFHAQRASKLGIVDPGLPTHSPAGKRATINERNRNSRFLQIAESVVHAKNFKTRTTSVVIVSRRSFNDYDWNMAKHTLT